MSVSSALIIRSTRCARREPLLLKRHICVDGFPQGVCCWQSLAWWHCVRVPLWGKLGGNRDLSAQWSWFIQRHLLPWAFQCILKTANCQRVKVQENPSQSPHSSHILFQIPSTFVFKAIWYFQKQRILLRVLGVFLDIPDFKKLIYSLCNYNITLHCN